MARVNITVPDELLARARAAGLSVSAAAAQGLAAELDRRASREQIVRYLAELDAELGPVPPEQAAAAADWADNAFGLTATKAGAPAAGRSCSIPVGFPRSLIPLGVLLCGNC